MAITLAEAKVGMTDKVDQKVIDEFRRSSLLLDKLTFDDTISPSVGGGSTLQYGYIRLKSPSTCGVRKINTEYTSGEAKREEKTAKAVILGGSFEIDRVIAETSGAVDEVKFQIEQKVKAGTNYFHNLVINGTSAGSGVGFVANTFDGLKKILDGTDTEIKTTIDLSTSTLLDQNYSEFLDEIDSFLSELDGKPDMLLMNNKMLTKLRSCARRAGYYKKETNEFGKNVEYYDGIPLLDAGKYYDGSKTIDVIATETDNTTAIYAICLGLDGFHGISVNGSKMMKTYLPNFKEAGAVKKGEVELIAGAVLKNTRKAGVLKGIKIKSA